MCLKTKVAGTKSVMSHNALCTRELLTLPVGAGRSRCLVNVEDCRGEGSRRLRALEQSHEEAGHVQCYRVEDHDATEPLVQLGWEYAWLRLSCLR
jgi:hypothetical protein